MRLHGLTAVAVGLAAVLLGAQEARAADLTGVWLGAQECDRYDGQKFHTKWPNDVMVITQNGDQMNMAALYIDGQFHLVFQGRVIDDAKEPDKKAQAAFTECVTSPTSDYQETGRATRVELKKKGDGTFEATSIFLQVGPDSTDTGTCSWTYKRVDTEDPGVPTCAELSSPTGALQAQGTPHRRP